MSRTSSSERLAQLAESPRSGGEAEELTGEVIRLGARRAIQELLEQEVSETLGRERYERRENQSSGYRNGCKQRRLDCAEGRLGAELPQVLGTSQKPPLWQELKGWTGALERLVVEMYTRGLLTRDIEGCVGRAHSGRIWPAVEPVERKPGDGGPVGGVRGFLPAQPGQL